MAIIPLPGEDKVKSTAPTQVVFRFDEHRFIQLTGYGCQGLILSGWEQTNRLL